MISAPPARSYLGPGISKHTAFGDTPYTRDF